jgi:hypothetical protein
VARLYRAKLSATGGTEGRQTRRGKIRARPGRGCFESYQYLGESSSDPWPLVFVFWWIHGKYESYECGHSPSGQHHPRLQCGNVTRRYRQRKRLEPRAILAFRRFVVPPHAFLLWIVLVGGTALLGMTAGTWVVPLTLAIWRDGLSGVMQVRTELGVFAHAPMWIDPTRHSTLFKFVEMSVIVFGIVGLRCGVLGERLYRFLVVEKLHWMTRDEVDAARSREKELF